MRHLFLLGVSAACGAALAQLPDVAVFADLRPTLTLRKGEDPYVRWLDPEGRVSIVGLRLGLENGGKVKVTQRMQRVPGDTDQLDEAWISINEEWTLGKQYLPFGLRSLYRESVPAISFNTQLVFDAIPAEAALFDAGEARPRGFSVRIGRPSFGVSIASGDHLAVQGTSLLPFRTPGQAESTGGGWSLAFGADGQLSLGSARIEGEVLFLRGPQSPTTDNRAYTNIRAFFRAVPFPYTLEAMYSHDWRNESGVLGAAATIPLDAKTSLRPLVRFDRAGFREAAVTFRLKL